MREIIPENKENEGKIELWRSIIALVTGILPLAIQLTTNSCENFFLKWTLIAMFVVSYLITSSIINHWFKFQKGNAKFLFHSFSFLAYLSLVLYVGLKKCDSLNLPNAFKATENSNNNNSINIQDNSVQQDNRKTYIYNKIPQRTINKDDVAHLLTNLPEKGGTIIVQYLKSRAEDTLLFNQICDTLLKMKYVDVRLSEVGNMPSNLQKGRITIRKEMRDSKVLYKVIVNPN